MDLQESRDVIRQADEEMARLFVRRMDAVRAVAAYKKERGLPIEDKEQEARVIEGRSALVEDPALRSFYINFLQDTMDVSKRWQHYLMNGIKVAYSGVEGAFAHIAAERIFPDGLKAPYPSFESAYDREQLCGRSRAGARPHVYRPALCQRSLRPLHQPEPARRARRLNCGYQDGPEPSSSPLPVRCLHPQARL